MPIRPSSLGAGLTEGCYPERGLNVEEELKQMMQELGNAINESLSESDRIAAAIGEIKHAGYEVFLVLEATIGFNKREDGELDSADAVTEAEEAAMVEEESPKPVRREFTTAGRIKWTSQDQKFLKALKIAVDNEMHS